MNQKIKYYLLIIFLFSAYSCAQNGDLKYKLVGDWKDIDRGYTFSFTDSMCSYLNTFNGEFTNYTITDSVITCVPTKYYKSRYDKLEFRILYLNKDSLSLYFSFKPFTDATLNLIKCKNQLGNEVVIDSISLITTNGWYHYPSIKMNIGRDGIIEYEGIKNVEQIGCFYGSLTKNQIDFLNKKFRNIEYKDIKTNLMGNDQYAPPTEIEIFLRNSRTQYIKTIKSGNMFLNDQPAEYKIFVNYLLGLRDCVDFVNEK